MSQSFEKENQNSLDVNAIIEALPRLPDHQPNSVPKEDLRSENEEMAEAAISIQPMKVVTMPERVRFTVPSKIQAEGQSEQTTGAILNLSVTGVAFTSAQEAKVGERVWLEFCLNLAGPLLRLLSEVIWCRIDANGYTLGLHFVRLTNEEQHEIAKAVTERSEGRSGEWPLPIINEKASSKRYQTNPWLTAFAGMAAGIALALVLSIVPKQSANAITRKTKDLVIPNQVEKNKTILDVVSTESLMLPLVPLKKIKNVEPVEKSTSLVKPPVNVEPNTKAEVFSTQPSTNRAHTKILIQREREVELHLKTDDFVHDHVSFWLDNPKRLVIDVWGRKSKLAKLSYVFKNALVSNLRVGQHKNKVRFVIETADNVSSIVPIELRGDTVVVHIQR